MGEYYLRDRYYSQNLGRFTKRDVYEGNLGSLADLNKYVYAGNNPVVGIDPTGMLVVSSQEPTITEAMGKNLEAIHNSSVTIRTYKTAKTSMLSVAAIVAGTTVAGGIMAISTARSLSRLLGIPVVFWGADIAEVTAHQFDAVTGSGNTRNNPQGISGQSTHIPYVLHRRESSHPREWMKKEPQYKPKWLVVDVDEYPYAITEEGGEDNYRKGLVSLRPVNFSQNRSNGTRVKNFMNATSVTSYSQNRYLSLFLNIPVPMLGMSFGLDRNGMPIRV